EAGGGGDNWGSSSSSEWGEGEGGEWEGVNLPEDNDDIDMEVIAALPDRMKKQVIAAAQRRQRLRSRHQYMPVSGDPAMYSQTQLANFLRSQRLNAKIMNAHKKEDEDTSGKRIASEAGRRYIMIPGAQRSVVGAPWRRRGAQGNPGDGWGRGSDAVIGHGDPSPKGGGETRRRRRVVDSDGDSDYLSDGMQQW
ncbi:unnamed protein product, partial [Discosporangium mesarthrocarpum]